MITLVSLFVYAPLTAVAVVLNGVSAFRALVGMPTRALALTSQFVLVTLWLAALAFAWTARVGFRDWVHLFWSVQVPLVGLFLGSGAFLCWSRAGRDGGAQRDDPATCMKGVWLFGAMVLTLGGAGIVLQLALPDLTPAPRDTGAPVRTLGEIVRWNFGGPRPEVLVRGSGNLPRDMTVALGTTLIAAWLWIGFCLLFVLGRFVRSQRLREAFYRAGPALLVPVVFAFEAATARANGRVFEVAFFQPDGARDSGIWLSGPAVLHSYGSVLLAALAMTALVAVVRLLELRFGGSLRAEA